MNIYWILLADIRHWILRHQKSQHHIVDQQHMKLPICFLYTYWKWRSNVAEQMEASTTCFTRPPYNNTNKYGSQHKLLNGYPYYISSKYKEDQHNMLQYAPPKTKIQHINCS